MITPHFKQKTTTFLKIIEVSIKSIGDEGDDRHWPWWFQRSIFFIWKKAWMTRKISAESWKIAVFEIPLSPWAFLEYFTQGNSLINSEFYPRKSISLSSWVGGLLLINKYILSLILIRGYSITQGKPFYSIYIYIRYLDSRTTTKFPWVNHSRELKYGARIVPRICARS